MFDHPCGFGGGGDIEMLSFKAIAYARDAVPGAQKWFRTLRRFANARTNSVNDQLISRGPHAFKTLLKISSCEGLRDVASMTVTPYLVKDLGVHA